MLPKIFTKLWALFIMFARQKTIENSVSCVGIGLHSGKKASIKLLPAAEDTGIIFKRVDVANKEISYIPAIYSNVTNTVLGTTLSNQHGVSVATIEHLMAAFWGCDIDNCIVETDGPEIPIMDGSSEPFVFLLECAGIAHQQETRRIIEILKEVKVNASDEDEESGFASFYPSDDFSVSLEIDFKNSIVNNQKAVFDSKDVSFKNSLCRARTFGFEHEVDSMQSKGLALGGSLDNAIVIGEKGVLNKEGLRFNDELVKHKILDCIGDVFLAGARLKGHFHGFKSGHGLNNRLLHTLFSDKDAYRIIQLPKNSSSFPQIFNSATV